MDYIVFREKYYILSLLFRVKSARRKPNQPSNPFADSEDEDFIADEEKFDQSFKGESLRNNASNR